MNALDGFRSYVATLCFAGFICAVLEHIFPQGNLKSVISAVLTLYILLTAVQGAKTDINSLMQQFAQAKSSTAFVNDYSGYAAELYREAEERGEYPNVTP